MMLTTSTFNNKDLINFEHEIVETKTLFRCTIKQYIKQISFPKETFNDPKHDQRKQENRLFKA